MNDFNGVDTRIPCGLGLRATTVKHRADMIIAAHKDAPSGYIFPTDDDNQCQIDRLKEKGPAPHVLSEVFACCM